MLATNIEDTSSSTKCKSTSYVVNIITRKFASSASSSVSTISSHSASLHTYLNIYLSNNFNDFFLEKLITLIFSHRGKHKNPNNLC